MFTLLNNIGRPSVLCVLLATTDKATDLEYLVWLNGDGPRRHSSPTMKQPACLHFHVVVDDTLGPQTVAALTIQFKVLLKFY
jgi:hypothetical protein